MRSIGLTPASLAFAAVLVAYWTPALVALRWGMWSGGDPIELLLSLVQRYGSELWLSPLSPPVIVVLPLAIGGTFASIRGLLRVRRAGGNDRWYVAAALLGVPWVLVELVFVAPLVVWMISCTIARCSLF
jgi:hypothetical protein